MLIAFSYVVTLKGQFTIKLQLVCVAKFLEASTTRVPSCSVILEKRWTSQWLVSRKLSNSLQNYLDGTGLQVWENYQFKLFLSELSLWYICLNICIPYNSQVIWTVFLQSICNIIVHYDNHYFLIMNWIFTGEKTTFNQMESWPRCNQ